MVGVLEGSSSVGSSTVCAHSVVFLCKNLAVECQDILATHGAWEAGSHTLAAPRFTS